MEKFNLGNSPENYYMEYKIDFLVIKNTILDFIKELNRIWISPNTGDLNPKLNKIENADNESIPNLITTLEDLKNFITRIEINNTNDIDYLNNLSKIIIKFNNKLIKKINKAKEPHKKEYSSYNEYAYGYRRDIPLNPTRIDSPFNNQKLLKEIKELYKSIIDFLISILDKHTEDIYFDDHHITNETIWKLINKLNSLKEKDPAKINIGIYIIVAKICSLLEWSFKPGKRGTLIENIYTSLKNWNDEIDIISELTKSEIQTLLIKLIEENEYIIAIKLLKNDKIDNDKIDNDKIDNDKIDNDKLEQKDSTLNERYNRLNKLLQSHQDARTFPSINSIKDIILSSIKECIKKSEYTLATKYIELIQNLPESSDTSK